MRRSPRILVSIFALALVAAACGDDDDARPVSSGQIGERAAEAAPAGEVAFTAPADGATVAPRFSVAMEADGVDIEPAGEVRDGAGHFHVMVDVGCVEPGETIPSDDQHLHFGDGSTTAELTLEPGEHTLCLQVGDGEHTALALTHIVQVQID